MKDGPDKFLWGPKQLTCLKRTLLSIHATLKPLISPTPMVGPNDARKRDNHTSMKGFQHVGPQFFKWILSHGLHQKGFFTLCGNRHWQSHAKHSLGIEEFSCGALVDSNSRLGRKPGDPKSTDPKSTDPKSTDPNATIRQLYTQKRTSGGFLRVVIVSDGKAGLEFYDEHAEQLYQTVKDPSMQLGSLKTRDHGLLSEYDTDQFPRCNFGTQQLGTKPNVK
ncbi:hypothetical protein N9B39_00450 [bacterium]|nr:hypothetical protein [bacterium]